MFRKNRDRNGTDGQQEAMGQSVTAGQHPSPASDSSRLTEKARKQIPKKLAHIFDYAAEEEPGMTTVFLATNYRCTLTDDHFFTIETRRLKSVRDIFQRCCYYDGCRTCLARKTSRCNKKCRHYFENRRE